LKIYNLWIYQNATTTFVHQKIFVIVLQHQQINLDKATLTPTVSAMLTTAIYFGTMEIVNIAVKKTMYTN
jgi:hypothetical protein